MTSRRRPNTEDKNAKYLKEIASIPTNKQCFDCLQRGPTYINITIGSFVCTTCSGILRGLTPPHRVKSISMTTFTNDEIEFLKSKGNEHCKYVWLGQFDTSSSSIESEVSDDQRKRDFMVQKYEKKRWYVDPDIAVKRLQSDLLNRPKQVIVQSQSFGSRTMLPETQPLTRLLGKSPTPLVVQSNQHNTESWPHPVSSASAPTISTKTAASNSHGSRSIDLLSEFASHAPATNQGSTVSTANGNFANFDSAFSSAEKPVPPTGIPISASIDSYAPLQQPQQQQPSQSTMSNSLSFGAQPVGLFNNTQTVANGIGAKSHSVTATAKPHEDRYAALADLDSLFNKPETSKTQTWSVETAGSAFMNHDAPSAMDKSKSQYGTASSNPFTSSDIWNQSQVPPKPVNAFHSANPFMTNTESSMPYSHTSNNAAFVPFSTPLVGNSPSDDIRSQFNGNFMSPTGTNPAFMQNGGYAVQQQPAASWGAVPAWSGSAGLFGGDVAKQSVEPAQHTDWIQNPVNPFAASNSMGFSNVPRNNPSNPFL